VWHSPHFPFAIAGGVIVVIGAARSKRWTAPKGLAVLWFVCVYVTVIGMLAVLGRETALERFLVVNPGRAILGAVALAWALSWARGRVGVRASRIFRWRLWFCGMCIVGTVAWSAAALHAWPRLGRDMVRLEQASCSCGFEEEIRYNTLHLIYPKLDEAGVGGAFRARQQLFLMAETSLKVGLDWYLMQAATSDQAQHRSAEPNVMTEAAVAPHLEGYDLASVPASVDLGGFLLVPVAKHVTWTGSTSGEVPLSLGLAPEEATSLLLLRILPQRSFGDLGDMEDPRWGGWDEPADTCKGTDPDGRAGTGPTTAPATYADGVPMSAVAGCRHYTWLGHHASDVVRTAWFLYDMSSLEQFPSEVDLRLPHDLRHQDEVQIDVLWLGVRDPYHSPLR